MLCCFAADFVFAGFDQGHGPTSPCWVALGTAKALLAYALLAGSLRYSWLPTPSGQLLPPGFSVCRNQPCSKGGTPSRATCCTLGVERGTTLCLKNNQCVLSPLAAIGVRKETASRRWFCQYFLKQFVSQPGAGLEQQVCSRAVFCGCSCNSPFFMWVGLQRVIFPAVIIRWYFFPEMFQWRCKAVNTWWGEAAQPKE